jgi:uncharacterized protein YjbI with pentapeptide repeats
MRYVADTPLLLAHRSYQLRPPKPSLTLIVKGTFDPASNAPATFADTQLYPTGEAFYDDDVQRAQRTCSDFALLKPCAEFLLVGKAYAPHRRPAPMIVASFRLGALAKRFAVVGDRVWSGGLISRLSDPIPFTEMGLSAERAYGGPGFDPNPIGSGRRDRNVDGKTVRPLPNLEDPAALIDSPSASPPPVLVGPRPGWFPARLALAGTYDAAYTRARWPWLPEDFDWRYFLEASPDQAIGGYFRGDERLALSNLHPSLPELETALPGIAPRVLVHTRSAERESIDEVPLRLDTVVWDSELAKLLLTWRGVVEVASEDEGTLPHIYYTHDPLHAPRPVEALRARFAAVLAEEAREEAEAEGAPPPAASADLDGDPPAELADSGIRAKQEEKPIEEAQRDDPQLDEAAEREREIEARLAALGVKPDAPEEEEERPREPKDPAAVISALEAMGIPITDDIREMLEPPAQAEEVGAERAHFDAPGTVFDAMAGPPIRERIKGRIQAGESLSGLDLSGVDLSHLDFGGQDLTGTLLAGARLFQANLTRANLAKCVLRGATLRGAIVQEANLAGADLGECDAGEADFSGSLMEDAIFEGARMRGAVLRRVRAARASFERADLTEAVLFEGDFLEADFTAARLERADVARARLTDATLESAIAHGARFDGSEMIRARGEGLAAKQAHFRGVRADDSFWERAELSESIFASSQLPCADFSGGILLGTSFEGCNLQKARFERCNAVRLVARRCDLFEATFTAASLRFADLSGSNLYSAELWQAQLEQIQLTDTNVAGTILAR